MHNNVVTAAALYFQRLHVTTLRLDFKGSQVGRGHGEVSQIVEAAEFLMSGRHLRSDSEGETNSGAASVTLSLSNNVGNESASGVGDRIADHDDNSRQGRRRRQEQLDESNSSHNLQPQRHVNNETFTPPNSVVLMGYSYGSLIAGSASASIPQCVGVISVAPPIGVQNWLLLFNSRYHTERARRRKSLPRLMIQGNKDNFTTERQFSNAVLSYPPDSTTGAVIKDADHFFYGREKDLLTVVGNWFLTAFPVLQGQLKLLSRVDLRSSMVTRETTKAFAKLSEEERAIGSYAFMGELCECGVIDDSCQPGL